MSIPLGGSEPHAGEPRGEGICVFGEAECQKVAFVGSYERRTTANFYDGRMRADSRKAPSLNIEIIRFFSAIRGFR
jgi:hypothetical protein